MASNTKPPRGPSGAASGATGWEQSEEVARRLLEDMAANEAREAEQRIRDKIQGRAVAEAHKQGVEVERPWLQEEEVYRRLSEEMRVLETRGFPRVPSRGALATPSMPPKLAPGATPPLPHLAGGPPINRTASVQAALDHPSWEQEEEMYHRLVAELAELAERGVGQKQPKWIPKASIARSPSTDAVLAHPPWEQEQEIHQRLTSELLALERRADARIESSRRGEPAGAHPPLEADQRAYDTLQAQLKEMEARADAPAAAGAMRRSSSRGALLPAGQDGAVAVHQRL